VARPNPTTKTKLPAAVHPPAYLPNEVLGMILDYIGDDKPTLASCMRVSQQLNSLVAPRLYARLEWGNNLKFPLTLPTPDSTAVIPRLSPTKRHIILSSTRELHLNDHCKPHCKYCPWTMAMVKTIHETLPIPVLSYKASSPGFTESKYNHIDTPSSQCDLLANIAPTKLVIRASYWEPLPIRSIDQRNLAKIVSWVNIDSQFLGTQRTQHTTPFVDSSATNPTVIYILHNSTSTKDAYPEVRAESSLGQFRDHLVEVMYKSHFASKVLVVNDAKGCTDADLVKLKKFVQASLSKERKKIETYWKAKRGGGTAKYKTVSAAKGTAIKFVDIQGHLKKHDTAGEFTDKEKARYMTKTG
jgi:hypothetical protein